MNQNSREKTALQEISLTVYLQPRSSKNEIVGPFRQGIKVRVTAPPVEEKANVELIRLLSEEFRIPASRFKIAVGSHSRVKVIKISVETVPPGLKQLLEASGR